MKTKANLVLLPGKSYGRRSLVGCSPWGCEESDTTEQLHFHFSLSCIGEGNGNPLQCSCLENPRDRGALWAAVSGVAQSRTRLKRLSSSSSSRLLIYPHSKPKAGRKISRRRKSGGYFERSYHRLKGAGVSIVSGGSVVATWVLSGEELLVKCCPDNVF